MYKHRHYKIAIQEYVKTNPSPQSRKLYKVINNPNIKLKSLLKEMVADGLISIRYENDRGKILRIIENQHYVWD